MSQHRSLLSTPADSLEDDSDYTVQKAQDKLERKIFRRKLLVCICVFSVIFVIAAGVAVGALYFATDLFKSKSGDSSPTMNPSGINNSKIFEYMNASYDPCEDFYEYSCNGWKSSHPGAEEWGTFEQLALDNYYKLAGYLSQDVSGRDPEAVKKAKYIYSACTDTNYITENLTNQLDTYMAKVGGWKNGDFNSSRSWSINDSLYQDHYLGSSAFFSIRILPDDLDPSKQVIRIYQDGLTLGTPERYFDYDNYDLENLIRRLLHSLHPHGEYFYKAACDIADFERTLAQYWVTETELRNDSALYNRMTLDELTGIFTIDWVNYFYNYFKKAGYKKEFDGKTVVIVETPSYFKAINRYLTRSAVVDYAKWQLLIHTYSLYTAPLPVDYWWKVLRDFKFPKASKLNGATNLTCVEYLENVMPLAVARPFVEEFMTDSMRVKVGGVAKQIKIAFKQRISEKDWLDEDTKERSKKKVDAITEQIAYPDFIKIGNNLDNFYADLKISKGVKYFDAVRAMSEFSIKKKLFKYLHPTDKTEWLSAPTEVNAYYSSQLNQFGMNNNNQIAADVLVSHGIIFTVILAGILRPPYYAPNWFPFLIYGALGTAISRELAHGFDDQGLQYDSYKWWTDHSIHNFKERTQCFVDQYNHYDLQGHRINGQLTLSENIADNGGIHTAFRAYKNVVNGRSEPNVQGHPRDQLFFVAFAQLWCSTYTYSALESDISTGPYSPRPIRMLGSLVNSEDFSNAFHCTRGSKMYPSDDRCELW